MEHAFEEAGQGLSALADHVLNLDHKLLLAFSLEDDYFNRICLVDNI